MTLFMPDGRQDTHVPDGGGTGHYNREAGIYNKLVKLAHNHFELRFQQGGKWVYSVPVGTSSTRPHLTRVEDRWGNALTMTYDANLNLTAITNAINETVTLEYDANGRIVRAWTPDNRTASWKYDQYGNNVETVDMEGHAFQYVYDGNVNVRELNTAQGVWKLEYFSGSEAAKSVTLTDPLNNKEKFDYTGGHTAIYSYVDKRGLKTTYKVDTVIEGKGKINEVTLPNGDTSTTSYDPTTAQPNKVIDTGGRTTSTTFDAQGNPLTVTDAKGRVSTFVYDANGIDLLQVKDVENNTVMTMTYNAQHQPLTVTNRLNQTTTFTYTSWGAPLTTTDAAGRTTTTSYDVTCSP